MSLLHIHFIIWQGAHQFVNFLIGLPGLASMRHTHFRFVFGLYNRLAILSRHFQPSSCCNADIRSVHAQNIFSGVVGRGRDRGAQDQERVHGSQRHLVVRGAEPCGTGHQAVLHRQWSHPPRLSLVVSVCRNATPYLACMLCLCRIARRFSFLVPAGPILS